MVTAAAEGSVTRTADILTQFVIGAGG